MKSNLSLSDVLISYLLGELLVVRVGCSGMIHLCRSSCHRGIARDVTLNQATGMDRRIRMNSHQSEHIRCQELETGVRLQCCRCGCKDVDHPWHGRKQTSESPRCRRSGQGSDHGRPMVPRRRWRLKQARLLRALQINQRALGSIAGQPSACRCWQWPS